MNHEIRYERTRSMKARGTMLYKRGPLARDDDIGMNVRMSAKIIKKKTTKNPRNRNKAT